MFTLYNLPCNHHLWPFWRNKQIVEYESNFVLEGPLYNFIAGKFESLLKNVVSRSLKSSFQLDHQVDITLYLMEVTALHHSKELDGLTPSLCTLRDTQDLRPKTIAL